MTPTTSTRPLDDAGPLLAGSTQPLAPKVVLEQTLAPLTGHLERVAWWPRR